MQFNYSDKDNKIKQINIEAGNDWNSYKTQDGPLSRLNSVFDAVDMNSDGKVDFDELTVFKQLMQIADTQIEKTKNNNIVESQELELLLNKFENFELETMEGNESHKIKTPEFIELPKDKDKLSNYTYLTNNCDYMDNIKVFKNIVDYSSLDNLEDGKYYVESWKYSFNEDENSVTFTPVVRKIQNSNQDGTTNWSEGINRNISRIQFDKTAGPKLIEFMNKVGAEQGFSVELLDGTETWIEDLSVVRADKKQLIPNSDIDFKMKMYENDKKIISPRKKVSISTQGHAAQLDSPAEPSHSEKYSYTLSNKDVVVGKTYLEGGNVLNTLTKNGEPAAVIGEESIKYTMLALNLEESEESINIAKKQIALELGIKEENVTYIPQFDFHIDMYYRPLNNGQMGIPDYEAGINELKSLLDDIDKQIDVNSNDFQSEKMNTLVNKKQEYLKLMNKLEEMKMLTEEISQSAENELKENGYEIVKIPCFTDIENGRGGMFEKSVENPINYMNGICGTSSKTGNKYYITNTSGDETLDAYMENYLKNTVGFDKVYFAPTKNYLKSLGGLDCITKEL